MRIVLAESRRPWTLGGLSRLDIVIFGRFVIYVYLAVPTTSVCYSVQILDFDLILKNLRKSEKWRKIFGVRNLGVTGDR